MGERIDSGYQKPTVPVLPSDAIFIDLRGSLEEQRLRDTFEKEQLDFRKEQNLFEAGLSTTPEVLKEFREMQAAREALREFHKILD
jgi:hypothetical protein